MHNSDHRFSSIEAAKQFALAGNAIITLQSLRSGTHFTYRIQASDPEKSLANGFPPCHFVKLLTSGSADQGDWTYLGMIKGGTTFRLTKASKVTYVAPSVTALQFFLASSKLHPELVIRHEGHCGRCGRTLTVPSSIDLGIGPDCAAIMGLVPDGAEPDLSKADDLEAADAASGGLASAILSGTEVI
jgi:uncharacterized protein DUF6011